jgi:hypothetical protein
MTTLQALVELAGKWRGLVAASEPRDLVCGAEMLAACADELEALIRSQEFTALVADAERYRWLRLRADSVIDWDYMPLCPAGFSPLEHGCTLTLDACVDTALADTASDEGAGGGT